MPLPTSLADRLAARHAGVTRALAERKDALRPKHGDGIFAGTDYPRA